VLVVAAPAIGKVRAQCVYAVLRSLFHADQRSPPDAFLDRPNIRHNPLSRQSKRHQNDTPGTAAEPLAAVHQFFDFKRL